MNGSDILTLVTIFVLSAFVGFEVIAKVPSILHTPLMSGTNAIHGVVLVGSMIVLGTATGALEITLGFVAVVLATINVVGGFVVTDRMLEMFKGRSTGPKASDPKASDPKASDPKASDPKASDPKASDPKASDPKASDPKASDPKASEQTGGLG